MRKPTTLSSSAPANSLTRDHREAMANLLNHFPKSFAERMASILSADSVPDEL
jgi:hypothetical protein